MQGVAQMESDIWSIRSRGYDSLEWAHRCGYLRELVDVILPTSDDIILDVGCGTGILTSILAQYSTVVGIDSSYDMIGRGNIVADCRRIPFISESFSKVTARMVFHHILDDSDIAISEFSRVLTPGGTIYISEGTPPNRELADWYTEMFKLKEDRLTLFSDDIVDIIDGDFTVESITYHTIKSCSIRNWLSNSGLDKIIQDKIYDMHLNIGEFGRKSYNMVVTDYDILIDMKFVTVVGRKK